MWQALQARYRPDKAIHETVDLEPDERAGEIEESSLRYRSFFCQGVVNDWNSLLSMVLEVRSLDIFKV